MFKMKKSYDFMGQRKTVAIITIVIFAVGLLFTLINGVSLDIKFTGGTLIKYAYSSTVSASDVSASDVSASDASASDLAPEVMGASTLVAPVSGADVSASDVTASDVSGSDASATDTAEPEHVFDIGSFVVVPDYTANVDEDIVAEIAKEVIGSDVTVSISTRLASDDQGDKNLTISLTEKKAVKENTGSILKAALEKKYPNVTFNLREVNSVDPVMGGEFFWKCMVAIILASAFMIIYVAFRFRKIGGFSAGLMAIIAIVHDCAVVFFTFVIFKFPINDNFVAAILTIIGYSINATIVIYDRVRENRRIVGPKMPVAEVVNKSVNETMTRNINTNIALLFCIASVAVVSLFFGISSIISFAIPMMFGVISGCYSSIFISNTLWVMWKEHQEKKRAEKIAAGRAKRK